MIFRWPSRYKVKEVAPSEFAIREVIATTFRNRMWKYHDERLNIDNIDWAIHHVQEQYAMWYKGHIKEENIIDAMVKILESYEYKLRIGTEASIKEYGK